MNCLLIFPLDYSTCRKEVTSPTPYLNNARNNECKMKRLLIAILKYEYERIMMKVDMKA